MKWYSSGREIFAQNEKIRPNGFKGFITVKIAIDSTITR